MTLSLVFTNQGLKLKAGKELQQLAENAGYSIHGGGLLGGWLQFLAGNLSQPTKTSAPPSAYTSRQWLGAICTRVEQDRSLHVGEVGCDPLPDAFPLDARKTKTTYTARLHNINLHV